MLPPPASCVRSGLAPYDELVVTAQRPIARLVVSCDSMLCWSRVTRPLPCGYRTDVHVDSCRVPRIERLRRLALNKKELLKQAQVGTQPVAHRRCLV